MTLVSDEPPIDLRPAAVRLALDAQDLVELLQRPSTHHRARLAAKRIADRAGVIADELERSQPAGLGRV